MRNGTFSTPCSPTGANAARPSPTSGRWSTAFSWFIDPVIPPRSNRKATIDYDRAAYKRHNRIARCVNRLKQLRRIATRYEKTARAYLSMLCLAAARLWIKIVSTA